MSDFESSKEFSDYEDDYDLEESHLGKSSGKAQIGLVDCNIKEDDVVETEDIVLGGKYINKNMPAELLSCALCKKNDAIRLLLKTFVPIQDDSEYCLNSDDRWLYLIQCNRCINKDGSIRCIREIKYNEGTFVSLEDKEKKDVIKINPFETSQANPFETNQANPFETKKTNPFETTQSNPFATSHSKPFSESASASLSSTATPVAKSEKALENESKRKHDMKSDIEFDDSECYKPYFIYIEKERFNAKPDSQDKKINYENIQIDDPSISLKDLESTKNVKEAEVDPLINKLTTSLTDPQFNRFTNILEYNPDQILRLSDTPIFFKSDAFVKAYYSKKSGNKTIPKLEGSSRERTFELQLMPYAISKLESNLDIDLKNIGMEWGTILVFTDPESYTKNKRGSAGESDFVEEFVYVQWDD